MYLIGRVIKAGACRFSCHGFTHVDSHTEELQIKADLSLSLPSPLPSTPGLEQGPPFAVLSVSDLVKLDILVTKAPHPSPPSLPTTERGFIISSWHPAPLCSEGLQLYHP